MCTRWTVELTNDAKDGRRKCKVTMLPAYGDTLSDKVSLTLAPTQRKERKGKGTALQSVRNNGVKKERICN